MEGIMIQVQETRLQRGVVFLSFMIMLLQIREIYVPLSFRYRGNRTPAKKRR